jgi:HSP20 family protein
MQPEEEMIIMASHDAIPWSRQEDRLPVSVGVEHNHEGRPFPLLTFHREADRP